MLRTCCSSCQNLGMSGGCSSSFSERIADFVSIRPGDQALLDLVAVWSDLSSLPGESWCIWELLPVLMKGGRGSGSRVGMPKLSPPGTPMYHEGLPVAGALLLEPYLQSILAWLLWRWSLVSYLPGLALNCDLPNLSLSSSWDYRHEYTA
jgi:hypothetical protein